MARTVGTVRGRRQARRVLDRRFADAPGVLSVTAVPRGGWVRTIREALGMSAAELGNRMGVGQSSVSFLERSESAGRIQLDTLTRAADALNCDMVYALVPRQPLERMVADRASELALAMVTSVGHTMRLEGQGVATSITELQVRERAEELRDEPGLWADGP